MAATKYKIIHEAYIMLLLDSAALEGEFLRFGDYMEQSQWTNGDQIERYEEEYKSKMISTLSKRKKNQLIFP